MGMRENVRIFLKILYSIFGWVTNLLTYAAQIFVLCEKQR